MMDLMRRFAALIIVIIILTAGCVSIDTTGTTATLTGTTVETTSQATTGTTAASSETATTAGTTQVTTQTTAQVTTQTTTQATTKATTAKPTTAGTTAATTAGTTAATIPADSAEYVITMKRDLLVLMLAYPSEVAGIEVKAGETYLVMASGSRILYDDHRAKSLDEKYTDADIQDMLEVLYPLWTVDTLMPDNFDPGRFRCYAFLNDIYGSTKTSVSKNLVSVDWGTQHLPFNKQAGASAALQTVSGQAAALADGQPAVADCLYPSSGTFNYRVIAGTDRLSPHAYAVAIDINSTDGGYWRWMKPDDGAKLLKVFPQDVVQVFERNNFIWGGKWNHFDLFHFEYRPEIILKAKYFTDGPDPAAPWYQGADLDDEAVRRCISVIDACFG
jgi:hypothetical protein